MFYLTTHSTHFILRLYGVGHMVEDHLDSERGNPLPPHGLLFYMQQGFFYMHHPRQDSTYHSLCYTSRGALAGTRNIAKSRPTCRSSRSHCFLRARYRFSSWDDSSPVTSFSCCSFCSSGTLQTNAGNRSTSTPRPT